MRQNASRIEAYVFNFIFVIHLIFALFCPNISNRRILQQMVLVGVYKYTKQLVRQIFVAFIETVNIRSLYLYSYETIEKNGESIRVFDL